MELSYNKDIADEIGYQFNLQMYGRKVPPGANLQKILPRASALCEQAGADPRLYVYAQLYYADADKKFPNCLISDSAIENVNKMREKANLDSDYEGIWNNQMIYLQAAIETGAPIDYILTHDLYGLLPWFRILITTEPNPKVIKQYGGRAKNMMTYGLKEYLKKKKYKDGRPFDLSRIPS